MKGWVLGFAVLTFMVLAVGLFTVMIWQISLLASTNQLIYMLGALASAGGAALYLRCVIKLLG